MSEQQTPQSPPDWRDLRRMERRQRRDERFGRFRPRGPEIAGVILIGLGIVFLAQNFGVRLPQNWWALFILIPAIISFASAWQIYQREREATAAVRGGVAAGVVLTVVAVSFLIGVEWGRFWPVILVLVGVGVLAGAWRR